MQTKNIDVATLKQWLDNEEAVLIDVREPAEHKTANIPGALLKPLASISSADGLVDSGEKVVLHCQNGARATNACQKLLSQAGDIEIYNLEGGIEAWQQAGLPVGKYGGKTLPLDRQVQLGIGSLVLLFSLLAFFINPAFALVTAFFGIGLMNAGLTGWCGLARLIAKMPWNQ